MMDKLTVAFFLLICEVSLCGMHFTIREKIDAVTMKMKRNFQVCHPQQFSGFETLMNMRRCEILSNYYKELADIVRNAGDLMSDQEKLNYLIGNAYIEDRDKIRRKMAEEQAQ